MAVEGGYGCIVKECLRRDPDVEDSFENCGNHQAQEY